MKSFIVIGHSGSGKTTWAKKFAQEKDLKYVDLDTYMDAICIQRGWKNLPVVQQSQLSDGYRIAICMQALAEHIGERCVFDGIYFATVPVALLKGYNIVVINPSEKTIIEQRRQRCRLHPKNKFSHLSDNEIDSMGWSMIEKYRDGISSLIPYADVII